MGVKYVQHILFRGQAFETPPTVSTQTLPYSARSYCIMTCCCGAPPPATMTCGCTCGRARTSIGKQSTHGSLQATDALGQRV